MSSTKVIFDSRTAKEVYKGENYYRSSDIVVPGGHVAIVELTTHKDYMRLLTFTAIRVPNRLTKADCTASKGIGKRYRRWKCCQSLGENVPGSNADPFSKSVVRWGNDVRNNELVEFEYIVRPGNYYLVSNKCNSAIIEDCDNPTIIEVTIVPVDRIPDLELPCCPPSNHNVPT